MSSIGSHSTVVSSQALPTLAEVVIDRGAITSNVRTLVERAAPAQVMAIVKADGYNHGAAVAAQAALDGGARQLGVATLREAVDLRRQGFTCPITAWMWYPQEPLKQAITNRVTFGIPSLAHALALIDAARRRVADQVADQVANHGADHEGAPVRAGLMVDTGLSRSGVSPVELAQVIDLLAEHKDVIHVEGALSHLASADMVEGKSITDQQASRFEEAIHRARQAGLAMETNHIANTPAVLSRPDLHYQVVRPGVSVYGVDPMDVPTGIGLRPAMTFRARVVTTRIVAAGEGVSYGHTWVAQRNTRTAVVAAGYADGVPRGASGNVEVSINGRRYRQIGRICMDQFVIELDDDADVQPGDWAVIFGESGPSVEEFAQATGTIAYEILTLPRGGRVARRVVN